MSDPATDLANFLEFRSIRRTATATPIALSTSTTPLMVVSAVLQADAGNTQPIFVGDSGITTSVQGARLVAGAFLELPAIGFIGSLGTAKYNLNRISVRSLSGSQVLHISAIVRRRDSTNP
jgi:hypothetical protein